MDDFAPARTRRTFEVIGDQIREQVRGGTLKPGDKLPPERTFIMQTHELSNATRLAEWLQCNMTQVRTSLVASPALAGVRGRQNRSAASGCSLLTNDSHELVLRGHRRMTL